LPRTKTIELDGAKFIIAALTLSQVEEFLADHRDALGLDDKGNARPGATPDEKKLKQLWRKFICVGLNNAAQNGEKPREPKTLADELDLVSFEMLRNELLKFSGLKALDEEKKTERAAAAAS
jgi:hypothetical protein